MMCHLPPSLPPSESAQNLRVQRSSSWIKTALWTFAFAALLLAGLAGYGRIRFGSFGALTAALRGQAVYLEPARVTLGALKPRERITVTVSVRNLTSSPLKLLGSRSQPHCGCIVAEKLPTELAVGEVKEVKIHLTAPAPASEPAEFEILVTFYTNVVGEEPSVVLHGRVVSANAGSDRPRNAG